jgi:hypothetical protein
MIGETRMIRQPFMSEADRLLYTKWRRAVAFFYADVALILFGLVVLGKPLGLLAPEQPADRAVVSAAKSGARGTACRGHEPAAANGVCRHE